MALDPFVLWLLVDVVGPRLADATIDQLKPRWERRLARQGIAASRVKVSKRRVRKWLSSSGIWQRIVRGRSEDLADLVDSLETALRRDHRQRRLPDTERHRNAEVLLSAILAQFLSELDPSTAVNIAHYREMWELNDLGRGQTQIRQMLEESARFDEALDALPKPTASALRSAFAISPVPAARLATYLTDPSRSPYQLIVELWSEPPEWLLDGPHWLLLSVAEFAAAHEVLAVGRQAFEKLAALGAPDRPRWKARAALMAANAGDEPAAQALLDRARELSDERHEFVEFCAALISEDPERVLTSVTDELLTSEEDRAMALLALAQAQDLTGHLDEAIQTFDELLTERPDLTSGLVIQGRLLTKRATIEGGDSRFADLSKAKDRCLAARDERRRWRGDSATPTAMAAEIALNLGSIDEALRIGLPRPDGEALDAEASSPVVASVVALAAVASRRHDIARRLVDTVPPGSHRSLIRGWLLEAEGDQEGARREYRDAYEAVADPADRHRVLVALALIGEWPLPDWEELVESDPQRADELAALSESARGLYEDAIRRLRRHVPSSRQSAILLAETYQGSGDIEAAVDVFEEARARFDDPSLLARAAVLLHRVDAARAAALATRALAELPSESVDRSMMHRLLVKLRADQGDWKQTEAHARALLAGGDNEPTTRWVLVMALYNQGRFEEAWGALNRTIALQPEDETQARLWIDLNRRFDPTEDTVLRILDIAEAYRDSEQLVAEALMSIYTMGDAVGLSDEAVSRLHAATFDFTDRFPESSIFSLVRADTIEALVEQVRQRLAPGSDQYRELVEQVWHGQLPYGFLSTFTGRPYLEALVRRVAGCLPAHDENHAPSEEEVATQALGSQVVVDTSALNILSCIPTVWADIRTSFKSLLAPRATVSDAVAGREALSLRTTMSLGWDAARDAPQVSEITDDEARELFERAAWITQELFTLKIVDGLRWQHLATMDEDRFGPWLAPLELALQREVPLYSDDVALRALARSLGVRAFNTIALLRALSRTGALTSADVEGLQVELALGFVVDLPLPDSALTMIADREAWRPGPASFITARPYFWRNPAEALNRLIKLYQRAKEASPGTAPAWVYAGSSGLARVITAEKAADAVGELLAILTATTGLWDPSTFKENTEAARAGLATHHQGDPLPRACVVLCQSLVRELGNAEASQALLSLVAALDRDDRLVALRTILQGCNPEEHGASGE